MSSVPAPDWFVLYRTRVLAVWVSTWLTGSSLVWLSSHLRTDALVFVLIHAAGMATVVALLVGAFTDRHRVLRKASGVAVLLGIVRLVTEIILVLSPEFNHAPAALLQSIGLLLVVGALTAQAGWLYWVAGLPQDTPHDRG